MVLSLLLATAAFSSPREYRVRLDFRSRGLPVVNQTVFVEENKPVTLTALGSGARDIEFVKVKVTHIKGWGGCAVLNVEAGKTVKGKDVQIMNPSISACDGSDVGMSESDEAHEDVYNLDANVEPLKN
jgi:hypothetical protein